MFLPARPWDLPRRAVSWRRHFVAIEIRNHGRGHSYRRVETGEKARGTTVQGAGLPKPGLMKWHAEEAAGYAVDHWDELGEAAPRERYNEIRKAPYAS